MKIFRGIQFNNKLFCYLFFCNLKLFEAKITNNHLNIKFQLLFYKLKSHEQFWQLK